jgi:hypothetical protein
MGKILNAEGKEVLLNAEEARRSKLLEQKIKNDLGYDIPITTLTTIMKKISEQKFFQLAPADYLPLRVGEGSWSQTLTTYLQFDPAADFATGIVNTGSNNGRLAAADAGVDALTVKVYNWAKSIFWTIMDLEMAAKSGNWDIVANKEKSRKKNWDLGIQQVAFLGMNGDTNVLGLLTQSGVTINTTVIPKAISSMTTTELKTFTAAIVEAYRSNCERTAWPTHFVIPESDYNGLASQASPEFPIKSTLQLLEETFKIITRNSSFQILPCAYGDPEYNSLSVHRYALYNYDEESLRMDLPVDYTNTLANSLNNFSFENAGYGQFTGVLAYRPKEMLYFQYA